MIQSRRFFLRGLGVSLALPLLESLKGGSGLLARDVAQSTLPPTGPAVRPRRHLFLYTPNGYQQAAFIPKSVGKEWELTPTLSPLLDVKDHVAVVTGLDRQFVGGTGVHAQCGSCWLSSSAPQETLDGGFPTNVTLDQLLAQQAGDQTLLPSLELSCNDFADAKESRYYECISWYSPGYAAAPEKNPREVFRRLFGRPDTARAHSVLDVVLADARSLEKHLGRRDKEKLAEYFESVRATERRIDKAEKLTHQRKLLPLAEPTGIPVDRGEYLRLQAELCVLAFQSDLTRVASMVIDPERWDSPREYHGLFDRPQNHHVLTHTKGAAARAAVAAIDRYHVALYAHIIQRLQQLPDGEGSLLDSTIVVMGSGISDGDSHSYSDLQVLVAGGGVVSQHWQTKGKRPLADLWLTLLQRAGGQRGRFADSTGPLSGVFSA